MVVLFGGKAAEIHKRSSYSPSIPNGPKGVSTFEVETAGLPKIALMASCIAEVTERPADASLVSEFRKMDKPLRKRPRSAWSPADERSPSAQRAAEMRAHLIPANFQYEFMP